MRPPLKSDARHRRKVEVYEDWIRKPAGVPVLVYEAQLAAKHGISVSTVRRYAADISVHGCHPRIKPGQGRRVYAWDGEALDFLKAFYLAARRDAGHCTMLNAYRKTLEAARIKGWRVGSEQSAYTHLRDIHSLLITYAAGGSRALDNIFYAARDLSRLAPMQVIVGDQHVFDYWVVYEGKYIRPQCYLWLDMRTRLVYGIAFEPGAYNHRTVTRALKMGIVRFGKFGSTYNDNGTAERSARIDHLVNALQTYGMAYRDRAELYHTQGGDYAVEDADGSLAATVSNLQEWRRQHRRMYARVKNAKAKPVERFFYTLEILLSDMLLPGYVRDIAAPAAEDEEAERRLAWQKDRGCLLSYEEFAGKVKEAVQRYEHRRHAGLKRSPQEELLYAREKEGWEPSRIDPGDIRHIFLESGKRVVKGNRIQIAGINYLGPDLTRDMIRENRHNLAGLSGLKVDVYYDPDDLDAGAWAVDPRTGETIFLTPEDRINPFNNGDLSRQLESKRGNMRTVSASFREAAAAAGRVLTSPEYKPQIEAEKAAKKALKTKTARKAVTAAMSEEDFTAAVAVANRLVQEQGERAKRQAVYSTPLKRYQAMLDCILRGEDLSPRDRLFKAGYESRMGEAEKVRWDVYVNLNQGVTHGSV
ncbi:MAG: Mu transposase C-terminal domain-containing protein [Treponema sp.]|jgi:putative transposase|nr:Mu transposase C-terminal domain-containing protein [Treponema sp.]